MRDSAEFDALAARLEELARTCAQLTGENARLREEVSRLSGSLADVAAGSGPGRDGPGRAGPGAKHAGTPGRRIRVSRRGFGVALAGAAAAAFGTTLFERGARHPALADVTSPGGAGADAAVTGQFAPASATATGSFLSATLSSSSAVIAAANNGTGPAIQGLAGSTGPGVAGNSATSAPGVYGTTTGSGPGMLALTTGTGPAVTANSARAAAGIRASSVQGRGGIFSGARAAQVQLAPGGSSHPRSGQMGDLYADSAGRLWYCKRSGASATWKQIA